MPDVFIRDAVRTPVGKLGGALAPTRPDDLAATVVRALADATALDPADRRGLLRRRQPGRRGQPQRRPHGRPAGRPAHLDPGRHRQPAVRLRHGGRVQRQPRDRRRRRRGLHRRRRRVDEPRAVGDAQAREALPARQRDDALHHARLADGQPARCPTSGPSRSARAPRSSPTGTASPASSRTSSPLQQPPEGGRGLGPRRVRRRGRRDWTELERDENIRADTTLEKLGQLKPGVPQGRHGHGGQLVADERRRLGAAAVGRRGRRPLARIACARRRARVEPQLYGIGPVEAANRALERAGIGWGDLAAVELNEAFAAQSLACLRRVEGARPGDRQRQRRRDRARARARQLRHPAADHARRTSCADAAAAGAWPPCASASDRGSRW